MRVGICSVGTELLTGEQVDTNAAWLSARLRELGAVVVRQVATPDILADIADAVEGLLARCDGVVVGGGLGPTTDDVTREALARVAGVALEHRDDLEARIRARFEDAAVTMSASNIRQARVPSGARAWPPAGTAPGFVVDVGGAPVWVLPGVPWELHTLFDDHVAPDVLARTGGRVHVTRRLHITGMGESRVGEALASVERGAVDAGVDVAYLATASEVLVKLTATAADRAAAWAVTQPWVEAAADVLGVAVAALDDGSVEAAVHQLLVTAGRTVATAESATAGLISARLAATPGASATLRGGAAVYATDTKATVAGVDPDLLRRHPPVSTEVTGALASSIRQRFDADYGVAATGVAGPASQQGVAVGTCVWAVCGPEGEPEVARRVIAGDRATIRGRLATAAIELLRRRLLADRHR